MRLLTLLLLLTARFAAAAPTTEPSSSPDFPQKADDYLKTELNSGRFAGSVMVARSNQIVFMKGYGLANRELEVANAPDTKFRLGSITKQFTALCILILQEQGKLSVEDPISKFVPDCPGAWSKIKVRHLLTHTSGIANFTSFPDNESTQMLASPPEKTIKRFRDKPLEFEPGERFAYSNSGYVLLGYIVEKASGQSYEQFVQQFVFKPLGMKDSGYDHFETILPHRATGYTLRRDGDTWVNSAYVDMSIPHGAGALYSTVEDFFRWYQCWREQKLVSAESWKAMTTPEKNDYGFGIIVSEAKHSERFGQKVLGHDGGINGFATAMRWLPSADVFVAAFANSDSAVAGEVANNLAGLLLDKPLSRPKEKTAVKLEASQLEPFVGRYRMVEKPEIICAVTASGEQLFLQSTGAPKFEMLAESETNFFLKAMPDIQVTFWKDASGKVSHLVSRWVGHESGGHEGKRLEESDPGANSSAATATVSAGDIALGKAALASSEESGHPAQDGNDGKMETRWCASSEDVPQWWQVDLGGTATVTNTQIIWEHSALYQYRIEVSSDQTNWTVAVDKTANATSAQTSSDDFSAKGRYVRIVIGGLEEGSWASFYEFQVFGSSDGKK
ncbi:MAG: serine hydrolase [Verrucomicrobiota bacterium]|jgi:CubicO group peptidase (beta-lactamase class C family)